jgi:hypothetical protein
VGIAPGIDVRGDGGYIVAVPSPHESGRMYHWADGCGPEEVSLPALPDWLKTLITEPHRANAGMEGARIREGMRNNHLTRLAGAMRQKGMAEAAIHEGCSLHFRL